MRNILNFLRKERLYLLLLVFVMLMNVIVVTHSAKHVQAPHKESAPGLKKQAVERVFEANKGLRDLFTIASLLILLILSLGLLLDLALLIWKLTGKRIDILTYKTHKVSWNLWDVCRVVILFSFFGYMLILIEAFMAKTFPVVKNNDLRMIVNSSILDTLAVVFIIYFALSRHKEKLIALGISFKNFIRNVLYGIAGYIAAVPLLLTILIAVSLVTDLVHYIPKEQAVVTLFMKEKNVMFLGYTVLFAALVGPMIEELFFRGFMYNALKKRVGIFWAALVTASIFAGLHAHAVGFVPIMALGLLLVYLYEKTGTLVAPITVHIIHNTSMVFLVLLVKQMKIG